MTAKFDIPMPSVYVTPDSVHHAIVTLINEINSRLPRFATEQELEDLMITRAQLETDIAALSALIATAVTDITAAVTTLESGADFTSEDTTILALSASITDGLAKLAAVLPAPAVAKKS